MIDGAVYTEEAVVDFVEGLHLDGLILGVMFLNVQRELLLDLLGVDGGGNFLAAFVEHCQHSIIDIVVEQHDAFLGRADEVGDEGVGIEDLPVEEDALLRLLAGFEQLEDTVNPFVGFYLMIFNIGESLEHLFIYST